MPWKPNAIREKLIAALGSLQQKYARFCPACLTTDIDGDSHALVYRQRGQTRLLLALLMLRDLLSSGLAESGLAFAMPRGNKTMVLKCEIVWALDVPIPSREYLGSRLKLRCRSISHSVPYASPYWEACHVIDFTVTSRVFTVTAVLLPTATALAGSRIMSKGKGIAQAWLLSVGVPAHLAASALRAVYLFASCRSHAHRWSARPVDCRNALCNR